MAARGSQRELRYLNAVLAPEDGPEDAVVVLTLATASGALRQAHLTEHQALQLVRDVAQRLQVSKR